MEWPEIRLCFPRNSETSALHYRKGNIAIIIKTYSLFAFMFMVMELSLTPMGIIFILHWMTGITVKYIKIRVNRMDSCPPRTQ